MGKIFVQYNLSTTIENFAVKKKKKGLDKIPCLYKLYLTHDMNITCDIIVVSLGLYIKGSKNKSL